ncbi:TPA: dUTP diphosphatase [Candidatus Berkelbacteria bacterium]|uniref:dUTP diphosphatase n=1 Tax=Berkelbacteria bacterium GW2011_GWE1_39_12 TaxID=1618337 RepID=A0A0G4B6C7_9BACT|nr:MAG: deoxyuridine 5-triphosphate nucleotidohydrolase, dUTP pyrophosphatase [Berkelbacteria bacterium GW2011_GWE1_39_12]HBO60344.1 dUTP diphosphatase [Candidatus Berkelbacteria bacterium]
MQIKFLKLNKDVKILSYAHPNDAGMDMFSVESKILQPFERYAFATGFALELPEDYVSLIWDKSGLAIKEGIHCLGGVIDAGYRGEYKVILINLSNKTYEINKGDKLAQLLIQPIITANIVEVKKLTKTSRGIGGFGSTGRR